MDTSSDAAATDTLGRRVAPRQHHTRAEKRAMVEESLVAGRSVAVVARRHEVNANQIFAWRRMYRAGLLEGERSKRGSQLLPVKIAAAKSAAEEGGVRQRRTKLTRGRSAQGVIEIEFSGGQRVRVHGAVDAATLAQVIEALSRL
jgi:transposase